MSAGTNTSGWKMEHSGGLLTTALSPGQKARTSRTSLSQKKSMSRISTIPKMQICGAVGLYDTAAIKYPLAEDAYFIFTAAYYHTTDALDIQLAASRDGIHFTRWREPFVRLGPDGAFDSLMLYMGVGVLPFGDELRLYYTGYDQPHDKVT